MLKSIRIDSLYGLYDYVLDLKPENSRYKFITGPNGYGKSTILRLLDALYNNHIIPVASVPFKTLELKYENNTVVFIEQHRKFQQEEGSDEQKKSDIVLTVSYKFQKSAEIKKYMTLECTSEDLLDVHDTADLGLYLFFHSHPIYHIRDGRIRTPEGEPAVRRCVVRMAELMKEPGHGGINNFDSRLEVFKDIISRAAFAHKTMDVGPRFGFRFRADDDVRTILDVEKLSSGEQHIVIQAFELLFAAPDDSLVLIDEPEISFHLAWQMEYLKNLERISEVRNLQFVVATHSPHIFNSQWELTVDLYDQTIIK